ncbi:Ecp2-2 [Fulvia fulva]|uniref:Ecp2-2 n=1 Tax=Passalora fulva TaxID=5499 RepID=A0A9Q8P9F9_PASFU|nr:Ecp2-2 [Fulvia fulva]KAK4623859.1 Ecp2-2 [Fulvia fulva]KAK4625881.1 Ecp2-2 [Fulvia fulva]UJO18017.1 Ecp2-2 [Fulvia fulva]WPV15483.1 Ecp2-2 [Fulvia fulva]WPV30172.1 Ecp2-2 [Fulvia fulva]
MQFTTTALAILLPAFAAAISNSCGGSSFVGVTANPGKNPLVSDCEALIADLAGDADWPVTTEGGSITSMGTFLSTLSLRPLVPGLVTRMSSIS